MSASPRWTRRLLPAVLALLAVWSLVPFAVWWAGTPPGYYARAWEAWGWGAAVALGTGLLLVLPGRGHLAAGLGRAWAALARVPTAWFVALAAAALALETLAMTILVFAGNARNVDGFAQLFQARIFLSGRLWAPAPPLAEWAHFATLHMVMTPERWFSQYPPGQSLVLAAGLTAGAWWALNPLLAAALAVLVHRLARWVADESVARLSLLLLLLSPFVVAVAGSEMSHLPAAVLGLGAAAAATRYWRDPGGVGAAAAAGLALGLLVAFRPLDAVAASVPALLIVLAAGRGTGGAAAARRAGAAFGAMAAGAILGLVPTLWYNVRTTGSALTFGYSYLWGPEHSLGFHPVPWGEALTPLRAVALTGLDLHQLNLYLFDLPLPVLALLAAGYVAGRHRLQRRDWLPVAGLTALLGPLFFYWHRDVFYGPRFLFTAVPWVVILAARGLMLLASSPRALSRHVSAGRAAATIVAAAFALGLVTVAPARLREYHDELPDFALQPARDAARAGVQNAVVVIPDGWGTRLIARMWALGVPPRRSTRIYRAVDACTLELALDRAEWDSTQRGARLTAALEALAAAGRPGVPAHLTDDPALRLDPAQPLAPACRAEVSFDRQGFLAYARFLYLNRPTLDGDIVWARDLGARNASLFARYPSRRYYRYARPALFPLGGTGPASEGARGRAGRPVFLPLEQRGVE